MAKKSSTTRVSTVYSKTKDSLNKYYKREFSTTKSTRTVVWEGNGYDLMLDKVDIKKQSCIIAVITKKDEKAQAVIAALSKPDDIEEFKVKFQEMYPNDYAKIEKTYRDEERKDKKGKGHPMPLPNTYLSNMYKTAKKKAESLNPLTMNS